MTVRARHGFTQAHWPRLCVACRCALQHAAARHSRVTRRRAVVVTTYSTLAGDGRGSGGGSEDSPLQQILWVSRARLAGVRGSGLPSFCAHALQPPPRHCAPRKLNRLPLTTVARRV